MGNSNTKEARHDPRALRLTGSSEQGQSSSHPQGLDGRSHGRAGRSDLSGLLGIQQSSSTPSERRETRQEREARRLERERQARLVERERSMKEEHVDGGYLVTLGTYVGTEDFNKSIVRSLQIDRRLAPFWRGLQDFSDTWTEYQIVAAARGLDIPPPDQPPPEGFLPPHPSSSNSGDRQHLTVSGDRPGTAALTPGPSAASTSASVPTGSLAGTSSPSLSLPTTSSSSRTSSSPFRPRAKAFAAALSVSPRNGSSTDLTPREVVLPHDPFVNGQPIEVFLYKNATECPICFLTYPPYLNHTRCCDQPICSECFVQIKRAEPHYPEGHGDNHDNHGANPEEQAGLLTSEPACCPYCQQPEFGVTYDAPPFRRGLSYASGTPTGTMATAMSSTSTLNSTAPGSLAVSSSANAPTSRRRTQSLSATAPNVVTTDRIRPDWSTKLASQRAHIERRAAAATALHTAAFLMGSEQRTFRVGRFSRWTGSGSSHREGDASPAQGQSDGGESGDSAHPTMEPGPRSSSGQAAGLAGAAGAAGVQGAAGSGRRNRMEDLEELMFREALRQSLATEDERRRKEEKEQRKEAKRREKEERKAAKAVSKQQGSSSSPYGGNGGSGHSSASASSLSLSGFGIGGRRRGNSGASNLRVEASVANAMAARGNSSGSGSGSSSPAAISASAAAVGDGAASGAGDRTSTVAGGAQAGDKGKRVDRGTTAASGMEGESESDSTRPSAGARHIPSPQPSAGPSHLRQMSSASSMSSSPTDSAAGSYANAGLQVQDPRASGLSLGSRSGGSDDGADHGDERDPSTSIEPMFNFSSLAELVGVQLEGEHAGRRLSAIQRDKDNEDTGGRSGAKAEAFKEATAKDTDTSGAHGEHVEVAGSLNSSTNVAKISGQIPEVLITPGTPAPSHEFD